jgi:plasmid stability protein
MMKPRGATMPSLQIRDLPPDVYEALSLRAEAAHRSLAQQAVVELRRIAELAARDRRMEVLAQIREELRRDGTRPLPAEPAELIREDRER